MSVQFDDLVREVRETLRGYGLVRDRVGFLTAPITSSALTITVDDASNIAPGVVEIDNECIYVRSVDTTANTLTVAPDGRGWMGTTAASHSANARVVCDPGFPAWRVQRAVNDTIVGVYPTLWGTATTSFTYDGSTATYSLPADAEGVLSVTTTAVGPDKEQIPLHGYRFEPNANATDFPTGKCLTLREAPLPGRVVTVSYRKAPSELVSGDALSVSGLRDTARRCLIYGAVAELLSFVDANRTLTESSADLALADTVKVGTATQLAAQMSARYQMELGAEQARLRQQFKPTIVWRGR